MNSNIINAMQNDMRIIPYEGEKNNSYESRLIYSALSNWLRITTQDELYGDNGSKSKVYILNRGREILLSFMEIVPETLQYFSDESQKFVADEVIRDIREKMLTAGEIVEIDDKKKITLPKYREVACALGYNRILGFDRNDVKLECVGVARITKCDLNRTGELVNLRVECLEFLNWIYDNAEWTEVQSIGDYEIFDAMSKKAPYLSWSDKTNKIMESYIGRMSIYNGIVEYWLFKFKNGQWFQTPFSSVLREYKEERRIFLGLRKKYGNPMIADYEFKSTIVILYLFCRLPIKEEGILDTFCWPMERYNDKLNYVVPYKIWDDIKNILEIDLGIMLRERL